MMQLLARVDNIRFDIEEALEKQLYSYPLPFIGMDKSASAVCELFQRNECEKGHLCPFRHVKGDKSVVCKHWLRGLCKKGDECEFLHEYDMSKMPECYFYSKYSQCGNKECEFLHLDKESKIIDCPWYDRGFCRHGPNCKNRHLKKVICQNYLFGFCPEGPSCKFKHPKFDLPVIDTLAQQKKQLFICDFCGEKGHKIASCFKLNPEHRQAYQNKQAALYQQHHHEYSFPNINSTDLNNEQKKTEQSSISNEDKASSNDQKPENSTQGHHTAPTTLPPPNFQVNQPRHQQPFQHNFHQSRLLGHNFNHQFNNGYHHHNFNGENKYQPPSEVTCYKCGEKGHYANRCNKGVFAFLRAPMDGNMTETK